MLKRTKRGQSTVEAAIMLTAIAAAVTIAASSMGKKLQTSYTAVGSWAAEQAQSITEGTSSGGTNSN